MTDSTPARYCSSNLEWWIGNTLRRYYQRHPNGLHRFRSSKNWLKFLEWNQDPNGEVPESLSTDLTYFLDCGRRTDNPWRISFLKTFRRRGPKGKGGISYPIYQFSITKVVTADEQERYMQERARAQQEFLAPKRMEQERRERERERETELLYQSFFGDEVDQREAKQLTESVTARAQSGVSFDFEG